MSEHISVAADTGGVDHLPVSIHGWRTGPMTLHTMDRRGMRLRSPPEEGHVGVTLLAYGGTAGGKGDEPNRGGN